MIKILVLGDLHCGDNAGLTPPDEQKKNSLYTKTQEALYDWYADEVTSRGPYDMTLFMGDMTEGQNNKNTIELYETNTDRQAEIAAECASIIDCPRESMYTVYGTPFHTAGSYSFEDHFCDIMGIARPKTVQRINVGGLIRINAKHTVGRSSIPYGQGTPTYKEMVNELLSAIAQEDTAADICIRAHAHYSVQMIARDRQSIVIPCLKYPGSVFGRKLQESQYDMGLGIIEVYGKQDWRYIPVHFPLQLSNKREWTEWNQEKA